MAGASILYILLKKGFVSIEPLPPNSITSTAKIKQYLFGL
jgi:hypothetical protein